MNKLLFITTSTLAANPRLVKAFETLKDNYHCEVICFFQQDWSKQLSLQIEERNPDVTFYKINRREAIFNTLLSKLIHKIANLLTPLLKHKLWVAAYASHDKTFQLERLAKKITKQRNYHAILAHNLGAFYPAFKALSKICRLHLDIEDFHPGETPYFNSKYEIQNRILLMNTLLKKADHISYAAPLIMKECFKLFEKPEVIKSKSTVVNNCFSQKEFQFKANNSRKIKFVWFSQNIAKGRGLETIIPILSEFSSKLELHLIGNLYEDFKVEALSNFEHFISVHPPQPQKNLNLMLADYDVGLAIEVESNDYNRQICLTNKIWTYLQSGLYILATNTPAQAKFMTSHPKNGIMTDFTAKDLRIKIKSILYTQIEIRNQKLERFNYAKQSSWEVEQTKFKKIIVDEKSLNS